MVKRGVVVVYIENMQIPLYQIDAFASDLFRGNPAAVCSLERWLPDETLQAIAAENNLAETAFYIPNGGGRYHLRWFTPTVEVDLCGHATLATAYVILEARREIAASRVVFDSKSGELTVDREDGLYALDFPARPPAECIADPKLIPGLGALPQRVLAAQDYLCVFEKEDQVRSLAPNMEQIAGVDRFAVIATAPGHDCDFVSRFFAPSKGVPEDPVTGRAHCTLIPYWAEQLGKTKLFARQISRRGGELWCELRGDRVKIAGRAVKYLEGRIEIAEGVTLSRASASQQT
jgi:PhzF family phenazine biosynthesis protein